MPKSLILPLLCWFELTMDFKKVSRTSFPRHTPLINQANDPCFITQFSMEGTVLQNSLAHTAEKYTGSQVNRTQNNMFQVVPSLVQSTYTVQTNQPKWADLCLVKSASVSAS